MKKLTSYTINKIDGIYTEIAFSFDDGSVSTQNIANLSTFNPDVLKGEIVKYAEAYVNGLAIEQAQSDVHQDVQAIVGQSVTI